MIIAFMLTKQDCDCFFFSKAEKRFFCESCGSLLNEDYIPEIVPKPKKDFDLCVTYDLRTLVSNRFKKFCLERTGCTDKEFIQIHHAPDYFLFRPARILKCDAERTHVRQLKFCEKCGQYETVVGQMPPYLKEVDGCLEYGLFRTDLAFSWKERKVPVIIAGIKTRDEMSKFGFKGARFDPIEL